jgi:hypothetical protein
MWQTRTSVLELLIPDHIPAETALPGFYVRATDAQSSVLVAGPFPTYREASDQVQAQESRCIRREPRCSFAYFVIQKVKD